ncbi:hypothetical protein BCR39DRAFT_508288 [Naematelia encephala]|uniref:Uncharacterized protein n=1 Tax=Naematelia encephala TaxID=71784 RepID=A0A1Y2AH20_9TREE|nr:hypothetical protein BCR39DRAFT_508288 [Naematelia encephala]
MQGIKDIGLQAQQARWRRWFKAQAWRMANGVCRQHWISAICVVTVEGYVAALVDWRSQLNRGENAYASSRSSLMEINHKCPSKAYGGAQVTMLTGEHPGESAQSHWPPDVFRFLRSDNQRKLKLSDLSSTASSSEGPTLCPVIVLALHRAKASHEKRRPACVPSIGPSAVPFCSALEWRDFFPRAVKGAPQNPAEVLPGAGTLRLMHAEELVVRFLVPNERRPCGVGFPGKSTASAYSTGPGRPSLAAPAPVAIPLAPRSLPRRRIAREPKRPPGSNPERGADRQSPTNHLAS